MRRLLIDAGNTRIKLALVEAETWHHVQTFPVASQQELVLALQQFFAIEQVWISNVAGEAAAAQLRAACAVLHCPLHFITAQTEQAGVRNGYQEATQLGSDRWAALIAAWHRVGDACLVVGCGTAITIDALSSRGVFLGGLILPGLRLMRRNLVEGTAQLQISAGRTVDFPRNTADAIFSGAMQAVCGAIRHQSALLGEPPVLLSGGDAPCVQAALGLPVVMMDNPVLTGLSIIAQQWKESE